MFNSKTIFTTTTVLATTFLNLSEPTQALRAVAQKNSKSPEQKKSVRFAAEEKLSIQVTDYEFTEFYSDDIGATKTRRVDVDGLC